LSKSVEGFFPRFDTKQKKNKKDMDIFWLLSWPWSSKTESESRDTPLPEKNQPPAREKEEIATEPKPLDWSTLLGKFTVYWCAPIGSEKIIEYFVHSFCAFLNQNQERYALHPKSIARDCIATFTSTYLGQRIFSNDYMWVERIKSDHDWTFCLSQIERHLSRSKQAPVLLLVGHSTNEAMMYRQGLCVIKTRNMRRLLDDPQMKLLRDLIENITVVILGPYLPKPTQPAPSIVIIGPQHCYLPGKDVWESYFKQSCSYLAFTLACAQLDYPNDVLHVDYERIFTPNVTHLPVLRDVHVELDSSDDPE
jgi:hypothetical protein